MNTMSLPTVQSAANTRTFPKFDLVRLLSSVFEPTQNQRICILIDLPDLSEAKGSPSSSNLKLQVQARAHKYFYTELKESALAKLGATGGEMFAYPLTGGSNLDMSDYCVDMEGNELSLESDVLLRNTTSSSASALSARPTPLTAHAKKFGFRGATLHGLNEVILSTGLACRLQRCQPRCRSCAYR